MLLRLILPTSGHPLKKIQHNNREINGMFTWCDSV